ncbi:MAG: TspO/MBR family protein [Arenimonas sp.]
MSPLDSMQTKPGTTFEHLHPKLSLVFWIAFVLGLGSSMALFFGPDAWFQTLAKPTWNPPSWLFGPVWTVLYILLGISAWMIRRNTSASPADRSYAMLLFCLQLALNLSWTPIFFGLHQPALAFVEICILWLAALSTALAFGKISSTAGYLLIPYLMWISFALLLNGTIWLLNN